MSRLAISLVAASLVASGPGCGYHLANAPSDPLGPFTIAGGAVHAPDSALAAAAEEGARAELAREGQLEARGAGSVIEIELLRVDEASEGIASGPSGSPTARAVTVTATGRARIRRARGAAVERDSGEVRVGETAATAPSVAAGVVVRDEAARAAARRLGEALVRRLLGVPSPGEP
jgi:hypothetical protein